MRHRLGLLLALIPICASSFVLAGWDEGVAAFKKGDYRAAATEFEDVATRDPRNWEAQLYLGRAYSKLGKYPLAEHALLAAERHAREAKPAEKKRIWKQLGFAYEKQKKYGKSREAYLKAGETKSAERVAGKESTAPPKRAPKRKR